MADIDFSWMEDLLTGDDADYSSLFDDVTDLTPSMPDTGIGAFDFSDLFNDDTDYSYLFDDVYDLTPDFNPGSTDMLSEDYDWSWLDSITGDEGSEKEEDDYQGIFGWGIGPKLNEAFTGGEGLGGLLSNILGGSSSKKSGGSGGLLGGLTGLLGGGDGGILSSDLGKILLAKYLSKQDESPAGIVPIGQAGFGAGGQGQGSMPDYRIFNLQPALMPGVGYANAPPPEMKHGGLASLDQGPGDITLARLEPGEFVMTRKATDNIGAKNLYRLMKQAERMA
jgi:hypothetical protein|tara:strand:+ start:4222 stop:5061 length:840 start_codon:yes stop_codon:yes gene_type:complete